MDKECCGMCKYGSYDNMDGYTCVNDASDYCTEWVEYEHTCEDWEEK